MEYIELLRVYDVNFSCNFAIENGTVHHNLSYASSTK